MELNDDADDKGSRLKQKGKKPYRPCPYCSKMNSKLRRHLETKHKYEEDVKAALLLPKHQQDKAFDLLKRGGF